DSLKLFMKTKSSKLPTFIPGPLDIRAEMVFEDGKRKSVEFYYGSGYLSQSSRVLTIPSGVREIIVYNSSGQSRKVIPDDLGRFRKVADDSSSQ
ncbi:MAG TPA: hypothetical protein VK625_18845, partial [Flavitalea sp.]|nr:hypothetical protein [Flavitalea sp.]